MELRYLLRRLVSKVMGKVIRPMVDARTTQLQLLPCPPGRVLFLGDSITELGEWSEWFPELACLNRGVAGDTVDGVRKRLSWTINAPSAISLLIGSNDLGGARLTAEPAGIADQTRKLVAELQAAAPDALLLINSVMPRTKRLRRSIEKLNDSYRKLAADAGATYIDLWPVLAAADGCIRRQVSHDHLHLTGAGYRAWVDVLRPYLAPFAIK